MKSNLVMIGILVELMARARSSWTGFLPPLAPTAVAYLLVSRLTVMICFGKAG